MTVGFHQNPEKNGFHNQLDSVGKGA